MRVHHHQTRGRSCPPRMYRNGAGSKGAGEISLTDDRDTVKAMDKGTTISHFGGHIVGATAARKERRAQQSSTKGMDRHHGPWG